MLHRYLKIFGLWALVNLVLLTAACETTRTSSVFNATKQPADQRVDTMIAIGLRYISTGEVELAMQNLKEALSIDPRNPRVHEALALAFQKTGEYALAHQHFKNMLKYDSHYTRGRNNYAVFLFERGAYAAACSQLDVVVQDVYYLRRSDAFANLGLCNKKIGNISAARKHYGRAIKLNPRHSQSYLELAQLDFQANDFTGAQSNLKQFHELVPKGVPSSLLLGYRIAKLFNQTIEAATYKTALKKLYPTSQEANLL